MNAPMNIAAMKISAALCVVAVVAFGCSAGDEDRSSGDRSPTSSTGSTPQSPATTARTGTGGDTDTGTSGDTDTGTGGGWLDGVPDWTGSERAATASVESDDMSDDMSDEAMEYSDVAAEVADDDSSDAGAGQSPLTGGSVDDNEHFGDYLDYREQLLQWGISVRDIDPSGRVVITVSGNDGLPVAGTEVHLGWQGGTTTLLTTADGTVRFHPNAYGAGDGPFAVEAGNAGAEADRGGELSLSTDLPTVEGDATIDLDVLFLLDATGSMSDEIDQLKTTIRDVAQRIAGLPGDVHARMGMTLYRDIDDAFVTSTYDFTDRVGDFAAALADVVADGGGDYPEALDEALEEAFSHPSWRPASDTVQLVFLVADAPPQVSRQVRVPYTESMIDAAARGIKIFPVSSSGTDDQAEFGFRQLAQFTGGRYVFLTYGAAGRATGESSDITEEDYENLSLDDLIVRTIAEEIADLTTPVGGNSGGGDGDGNGGDDDQDDTANDG